VLPFVGNALDFVRTEPHELLYRYSREYGDLCKFSLGPKTFLFANNPKMIESILVTDREDYHKGIPTFAIKPIVRNSIFIVNNPQWIYGRANHPYTSHYARTFIEQSAESTRDLVRERFNSLGLANGGHRKDLYADLVRMAFDSACITVLGKPMPDGLFEDYLFFMRVGALRIKTGLPTPDPRFARSLDRWFGYLRTEIERHTADADAPGIFGYLGRHGTALNPDLLLDEISTMITGGVHPMASVIAATLYARHEHAAATETAVRQARELVGTTTDFTLNAAEGLKCLDQFMLETFRLYSPVAVIARQVRPDRTAHLGAFDIPPGTEIFISSWAMHRHPEYWPDPLVFQPDRFESAHHGAMFMPFGFGERSCVGQQFALAIVRTTLAVLFGEFEVSLNTTEPLRMSSATGFVCPSRPMPASISSVKGQ
jgi:cytochrome P450